MCTMHTSTSTLMSISMRQRHNPEVSTTSAPLAKHRPGEGHRCGGRYIRRSLPTMPIEKHFLSRIAEIDSMRYLGPRGPHLVSSCPEPMDLLLLFTPELKRILGIPLTNPPKSWRTFSIASHKSPIFSWSWTFFVGAAPECACPNLRVVPVGLHRNQSDSVRIAKQMRVTGMACALPMHI